MGFVERNKTVPLKPLLRGSHACKRVCERTFTVRSVDIWETGCIFMYDMYAFGKCSYYTSEVYENIFDNCVDSVKKLFFVKLHFKISLEVFTHKANASICECFQWVCHDLIKLYFYNF